MARGYRTPSWRRPGVSLRPAFPRLPHGRVILAACGNSAACSLPAMLLEMDGALVLSARDGNTALEISRSFHGGIDLVVTEADLPGLGCTDLCSRLLEERPGVKVLVISAGETGPFSAGERGSLPVPTFDGELLRERIRSILAAPPLRAFYVYMIFFSRSRGGRYPPKALRSCALAL